MVNICVICLVSHGELPRYFGRHLLMNYVDFLVDRSELAGLILCGTFHSDFSQIY